MAVKLPKFSLGTGPDRVFNLIAIALAALLIVGLCGLGAWFTFLRPKGPSPAGATAVAGGQTPVAVQMTPIATWTFTPTSTPIPPTFTPTPTPVLGGMTPTPTPSPTPAEEGAEGEATPTPAETPAGTPATTPQTGLGFPILGVGILLALVLLIVRRARTA